VLHAFIPEVRNETTVLNLKEEPSVQDVQDFWEANPLWTGESNREVGSREWFAEHKQVVINDVFAGKLPQEMFPSEKNLQRVLDLGCGPGFWTIELGRRGAKELTAADLTENALALTKRRAELFEITTSLSQQNAQALTFKSNSFTHVNCLGVIHHTPNAEACVREIARVLEPGGTATLSVYYRNFFLRNWKTFRWFGKLIARLGGKLEGRGREDIFATDDVDNIVRLYDGDENPLGKAYSRDDFVQMLTPYFRVESTFLHFFPARALPLPVPRFIHRWLERVVGFMIVAKVAKKSA